MSRSPWVAAKEKKISGCFRISLTLGTPPPYTRARSATSKWGGVAKTRVTLCPAKKTGGGAMSCLSFLAARTNRGQTGSGDRVRSGTGLNTPFRPVRSCKCQASDLPHSQDLILPGQSISSSESPNTSVRVLYEPLMKAVAFQGLQVSKKSSRSLTRTGQFP